MVVLCLEILFCFAGFLWQWCVCILIYDLCKQKGNLVGTESVTKYKGFSSSVYRTNLFVYKHFFFKMN